MIRPGYRSAIEWIASNDDNYWTESDPLIVSVTAAMVVDLWGVPEDRVVADIRRAWTTKFSGK